MRGAYVIPGTGEWIASDLTSGLGQTRLWRGRLGMSALPADGDICWRGEQVSFVPIAVALADLDFGRACPRPRDR
jgi:hypothetical protein